MISRVHQPIDHNKDLFSHNSGLTVFEVTKKRPGDKRKRERNSDASDVDGYLGPWGKFVDEKTVAKPTEVDFVLCLLAVLFCFF